jgi:hypothetical protein
MPPVTPISRLFAFTVIPRDESPVGGPVEIVPEIQQAFVEAYRKATLDHALPVSFTFGPNRENPVRDLLRSVAFDENLTASSAAHKVAVRLGTSMDLRSRDGGLLVVSVGARPAAKRKQLVLWLFPKAEGIQLSTNKLLLLNEVFSRSSSLRKAATFEGLNVPNSFVSGRLLDSQANASDRHLADFWLIRFLECQLQIRSQEGTDLFAKALRIANEKLEGDPEARQQLAAGIAALRVSPQPRWSIDEFSDRFLSGRARDAVIDSAPNSDTRRQFFQLDVGRLDTLIQLRIFELESGVTVAVPFAEVDSAVTLTDRDGQRFLQLSGAVVNEKLRARRGN